jgi:excisionase family DNA binding protein
VARKPAALSDFITVDEAATRLGVTVDTVRRKARTGAIAAKKQGNQWLIDKTKLPAPRPKRQRSAVVDVKTALNHVRALDLKETFVPDVLRFADVLDDEPSLLRAARSRFQGTDVGAARRIEVDKTPFFTRPGTALALEDRVAYQAAVASLAPAVEAATPSCVFSARLSTDKRYFSKRGATQWAAWRKHVLAEIDAGHDWMIKTDLTSYFDVIPHRKLAAEIAAFAPDDDVKGALDGMLRRWAHVPGHGLAQGPNASRLLGNLYLLPVDRAMLAAGFKYSRFMDDVRIVATTKADAVAGIRLFERECRARGLIVSAGKTALLHGADARRDLQDDKERAAAAYFMEVHATTIARRSLKKILGKALRREGSIDVRGATFSLWRLAQLLEPSVLTRVLNRLEDLAPLASVVAAYLRPFISRPRVVNGLARFFADPQRSYSPFLGTWLFAAMLEHPGTLPSAWADQAAARVKDRNAPSHLRSVAAVVMARGRRAADIDWIKAEIAAEHDPEVLRGYAVALHWVGALDRATQKQLIGVAPSLAVTMRYLAGRTQLPSLVATGQMLKVT